MKGYSTIIFLLACLFIHPILASTKKQLNENIEFEKNVKIIENKLAKAVAQSDLEHISQAKFQSVYLKGQGIVINIIQEDASDNNSFFVSPLHMQEVINDDEPGGSEDDLILERQLVAMGEPEVIPFDSYQVSLLESLSLNEKDSAEIIEKTQELRDMLQEKRRVLGEQLHELADQLQQIGRSDLALEKRLKKSQYINKKIDINRMLLKQAKKKYENELANIWKQYQHQRAVKKKELQQTVLRELCHKGSTMPKLASSEHLNLVFADSEVRDNQRYNKIYIINSEQIEKCVGGRLPFDDFAAQIVSYLFPI